MDIEFNKREDQNRLKLSEINRLLTEIKKGGGEKRLQKLRDEGKMTARERIDYLLDKDSDSIEIGAFAGYEMYESTEAAQAGVLLW
jgi:acetyl-CoA carboxylase carboxyltransferase component